MTCLYWYNLSRYADRARCAITGEFCQNSTCPVNFGPWGAWRAFVGQFEEQPWGWAIRVPVELSPCYYVVPGREDTDAVGWSP